MPVVLWAIAALAGLALLRRSSSGDGQGTTSIIVQGGNAAGKGGTGAVQQPAALPANADGGGSTVGTIVNTAKDAKAIGGVVLSLGAVAGAVAVIVFAVVVAVIVIVEVVLFWVSNLNELAYGQKGATRDFEKKRLELYKKCFEKIRADSKWALLSDNEINRITIPFVDGYMFETNRRMWRRHMALAKFAPAIYGDTPSKVFHQGFIRGRFVGYERKESGGVVGTGDLWCQPGTSILLTDRGEFPDSNATGTFPPVVPFAVAVMGRKIPDTDGKDIHGVREDAASVLGVASNSTDPYSAWVKCMMDTKATPDAELEGVTKFFTVAQLDLPVVTPGAPAVKGGPIAIITPAQAQTVNNLLANLPFKFPAPGPAPAPAKGPTTAPAPAPAPKAYVPPAPKLAAKAPTPVYRFGSGGVKR